MAVDKLVDSAQLDADLEDIADAIRAKGGTSASLAFPNDFVSAVQAIPTGITPSGTKSITENGTYDVTQYASANVSVSGGGGFTTIASGTFVGNDGSDTSLPGRQQFSIGKKMAQTDFYVFIAAGNGSVIAKSTARKFIYFYLQCDSTMGRFDLSSDGNKSFSAGNYTVDSDDSGTITTRTVADLIKFGKQIYNGSISDADPGWFQIRRYSDRFDLAIGISNNAYSFTSECTYSWKVVYYGSNPSTDIIEIS